MTIGCKMLGYPSKKKELSYTLQYSMINYNVNYIERESS